MSVKIITRASDLAPFAAQWNALAAPFRTPVLSYEWVRTAAEISEQHGNVHVVLILEDEALVAAAALIAPRGGLSPALEFLGNPFCKLHEPCGFLYRDEAALAALLNAVIALGKPLKLDKLPNTPTIVEAFAGARRRTLSPSPKSARSLFVPREGEWAAFEASMSKSSRETLRRKRKQAEKFGPISFQNYAPDEAEFPALLKELIRIEASGWKGAAGTAIASNPYQRQFFETYGAAAAKLGIARVFVMRIGEEVAAVRLAIEYLNCLWELKIGFNDAFSKCSPGQVLTHETLRYVFEHGLDGHEFLGADEAWERVWTDTAREYLSFRLYPYSIAGLAGLGEHVGQAAWARARRALAKRAAPAASPAAPAEA
jgi:CelD/BcsL family acetyltransferase involved in cellulose biosynthesis